MAGTPRPGALIPAAALVGLLLFDLLRVWLPSLLFIAADAGATSALVMGAIAIGTAALAPLICAGFGSNNVRIGWPLGVALLVLGRLLLQLTAGGAAQFVTVTVALVGAGIALGAIGAAALSGHDARTAVLLGLIGSIVIHAGLGTTDLVWRDGFEAWAVLIVILSSTMIAAHRAWPAMATDASVETGPAWPWWLFGPILVLLGVLTAPPGRVATATGWDDPLVVATVVAAHGLAVIAVIGGRWLGPTVAGPAGAGLVLFGAAGSLPADSLVATFAQVLLAAGIGLVVAATDGSRTNAGPRARAVAAAGFPLVFVLFGFAYYAGFDIVLPVSNRVVLLLASAIVAGAGLLVATRGGRRPVRARGVGKRLATIGVVTLAMTAVAAGLVVSPGPATPERGGPDEPINLALFNIQMGFDPAGQLSIGEVGDVLAAESPDIVVLNEVDRGWLTTGNHDTLRMLQARLNLPYTFGPAADELWGNAVLSRYPVTEMSVERLPTGRDAMARSQLIVILEVATDQRVALVATHLSHVDVQGDTRLPQARAVAGTVARLQDRGVPVIVAGDLNAEPDDAELATFGEVAGSAVSDGTATWPAWDPEIQIDHVLITNEFQVIDFEVPQVEASDHLPVFVTLQLRPDG